jgi:phosphatidylserine/phosphatidylglycerophosphate/cardiolipin synthase-like enzyme
MGDLEQFELRLAAAVRADAAFGVGRFDPATVARAAIAGGRRRSVRDRLRSAARRIGGDTSGGGMVDTEIIELGPTRQRPGAPTPRRTATLDLLTRLAAGVVIGLMAIGGAFYLVERGNPAVVGGPSATPAVASPSGPSPTPTPVPSPTPTPRSSPMGSMGVGRQIHTTTLLVDGRVLIVGGYGSATLDAPLADAVVYDPTTDTFVRTSPLAEARGLHTATLLLDGRVLITGGGPASWSVGGAYLATAEIYDPSTRTFSPTGSMSTPREDHTATLLRDGRVLIIGGNDFGSHTTASAELYDPKTGTFTPTGSMETARGFHTATLLADGRVLVTGGDAAAWDDSGPFLASAEVYDPKTGTFTTTGHLATGRAHHAATLLADGRVLITGGTPGQAGGNGSGTTSLTAAELYDPITGTFSPTGPMAQGRVYHTATRLADGRVLVAGGCDNGRAYATCLFLSSAELYDPKTGTFSTTASMADPRVWASSTLLADGRVLITGGNVDAADPLSSAEIYDPNTATFSLAGAGA